MLTTWERTSSFKKQGLPEFLAINPNGTVLALTNDAPDCCNLERYHRNLTDRPAFCGHVMVPCNELRIL